MSCSNGDRAEAPRSTYLRDVHESSNRTTTGFTRVRSSCRCTGGRLQQWPAAELAVDGGELDLRDHLQLYLQADGQVPEQASPTTNNLEQSQTGWGTGSRRGGGGGGGGRCGRARHGTKRTVQLDQLVRCHKLRSTARRGPPRSKLPKKGPVVTGLILHESTPRRSGTRSGMFRTDCDPLESGKLGDIVNCRHKMIQNQIDSQFSATNISAVQRTQTRSERITLNQ